MAIIFHKIKEKLVNEGKMGNDQELDKAMIKKYHKMDESNK